MIGFRPMDAQTQTSLRQPGARQRSPFTATRIAVFAQLQEEVDFLSHRRDTDVWIEALVSSSDIRLDRQLYAGTEVADPVVVAFDTRDQGTMRMVSDYYTDGHKRPGWLSNVRAVGLTLEALRSVDRWGAAARGQQYRGWAAIESETGGHALGPGLTPTAASKLLAMAAGELLGVTEVLNPEQAEWAFRKAAKTHHPDVGGEEAMFVKLTAARDLLVGGR